MHLAWAMPLIPYPPTDGGSIRLYQLLKNVALHHSIHLLALSSGSHTDRSLTRLRQMCASVEIFDAPTWNGRRGTWRWWRHHWTAIKGPAVSYYRAALHARLRELVRTGQADVILLESLKMSGYGLPRHFSDPIDDVCRARMILCRHNYEPDLAGRMAGALPLSRVREKALWRLGARRLRSVERDVARQYRFITAVSEREAAVFRRLAPHAEVVVAPNGAELDGLPRDGADDGKTVAMIGSLQYPPNQDAARYFYREIWPLIRRAQPDARLVIVGRATPGQLDSLTSDPSIEVRDPGPDPRRHLPSSTLVVVPLRAGGGTRIKILEAFAAGKAVVSTSMGCEGLDVEAGRDLLVNDSPAGFAQAVVTLLSDTNLRRRLGESGRSLIARRYTWASAAGVLESLCERVAGKAVDAQAQRLVRHA